MKVGDADRAVSFAVLPAGAEQTLTIVSEDPTIATYVDGKVKAVKDGATNIKATATDGSGKTASIAVTINPA